MEHPVVYLPTDVAAAVHVATSVEASPWEAIVTRCPVASRLLSRRPSPSRWHRDGLWGCDSALTKGDTFVAASWQWCQEGRVLAIRACLSLVGLVVCYKPAVQRGFVVLPRLFARCLALKGLSRLEVVSVSWDPRPRDPVEGALRDTSVLKLSGTLRGSECIPSADQTVLSLSRPCVGAEAGARLASRACRLRVPLLAASGGGLVAVVVTTFSSRRFRVFLVSLACTAVLAWLCLAPVGVVGLALGRPVLLVVPASVFSQFRGPILGCQPVMASVCVASRPRGVSRVRSGSACGPSALWRFEVVVLALGAHRRGSSVLDGLQRRLWRHVVVNSSESEHLGGDASFGVPGGGPGGRVVTMVSEPGSTDICVRLPCMMRAHAAGCSCYCVACEASVVARCVRAVGARLALDSLAVVFLVWRMLASQSSEVLLEFFSVGSGGSENRLKVSLRTVPHSFLLLSCHLRLVSLFVSKFSRPCWRTLCVPVARMVCFVLAPGVLLQMVVWVVMLHCGVVLPRLNLGHWVPVGLVRVATEVVLLALARQGVIVVFAPRAAESVLRASCGESFLLAVVLLWPLVHLSCTLFTFAVCGSTMCSCLSVSILRHLELWCIVLYHGGRWYAGLWSWLVSRFSFSLSERSCLAVVPCFGLGPSEVGVLSLTSAVVSVPMWLCVFLVVGMLVPALSSVGAWRVSLATECVADSRGARRDISRGITPVERNLIAARLAVVIRVAVVTWFPVAIGRLSQRAAPSHQGYCCGALPRPDGIAMACGGARVPVLRRVVSVAMAEGYTFVAASWQRCQEGRVLAIHACLSLAGLVVCYKPTVRRGFVVLPRLFARCLALEGLSRLEVVSISWDPILGSLLREHSGLRACSRAEAGARLASRACRLRVPLLATSGGGLVAVVTRASGGSRFGVLSVSWSHSWLPARDGTGVCSFPTSWRVQGSEWCVEGCFRFVPYSVGFCGSRFLLLWPVRDW
ncbi:hypothetical protein Taro_031281 [Colocasia esculenta]|uniref:Uncharacterized protein n=1 Tax=Colocasia esculenta TaxID=4460 RepID=A0A843VIH7_COLES|nr:hypothetical protein [Colocasia esculenta]